MTPTELAEKLRTIVESELDELDRVEEEDAGASASREGAWTKKQELGHLIDSASNNHARFVRAALGPGDYEGPGYAQDAWVGLHGYQDLPWEDLVTFWCSYNLLMEHMVSRIPQDRLNTPCSIGGGTAVSLGWLIEDYMVHMQHHLDHILAREHVTAYPRA